MSKVSLCALLLLISLCACGHADPAYAWVPAKAQADTCLLAYDTALEAWRETRGELAVADANTADSLNVVVVAASEMPCGGAGCTIYDGDTGEMYISEALSWHTAPSVAVHEWLHLIARRELGGDGDPGHELPGLWAGNDPDGVRGESTEAVAVRAAAHGPCLGDPGDEPLP